MLTIKRKLQLLVAILAALVAFNIVFFALQRHYTEDYEETLNEAMITKDFLYTIISASNKYQVTHDINSARPLFEKARQLLQKNRNIDADNPDDLQVIDSLEKELKRLDGVMEEASRASGAVASEAFVKGIGELERMAGNYSSKEAAHATELSRRLRAINLTLVIFITCGGVLAIIFSFLAYRSIIRPLHSVVDTVKVMASGDLRMTLSEGDKKRHDEVGELIENQKKMVDSLNTMVSGILTIANSIVDSLVVLIDKQESAIEDSNGQMVEAEKAATAAEEMSQTINEIAKNSATASATSASAMKIAADGKHLAEGTVQTINRVHSSTVELASVIGRLNEKTAEIGDVVTVIKDIADQTNLLALNAAIEAARAGEQGRGFAVVADEVRKLAEKTIKATDQIASTIGGLQQEAERTSATMTESSNEVSKATDFVSGMGRALNEIVTSVNEAQGQIMQIATSVEEQSATAEHVSSTASKSVEISNKTIEDSKEAMVSALNLLLGFAEFRDKTAAFKFDMSREFFIDLVKTDHLIFTSRIFAALTGTLKLDPDKIVDHKNCRMGKWYYGEGQQLCGNIQCFRDIDGIHAKFHSLARDAVRSLTAGDKEQAMKHFLEVKALSKDIVALLDRLKTSCK